MKYHKSKIKSLVYKFDLKMKLFAITVFFMSCNIAFAMNFRLLSMFVFDFFKVIYFIRLHLTSFDLVWPNSTLIFTLRILT